MIADFILALSSTSDAEQCSWYTQQAAGSRNRVARRDSEKVKRRPPDQHLRTQTGWNLEAPDTSAIVSAEFAATEQMVAGLPAYTHDR